MIAMVYVSSASMALDGNDAALASSFTSIFFYGVYLPVAFHCSRLLYARHKAGRGHTYLTATHISSTISQYCLRVNPRSQENFGLPHTRGTSAGQLRTCDELLGYIVSSR
ncbi:hypothetical protein CPB85DRAFT_534250 [Mucidula mucida]|nr:hypothetical protein CPB85DRAFT_534250 [Mucidula mucida]